MNLGTFLLVSNQPRPSTHLRKIPQFSPPEKTLRLESFLAWKVCQDHSDWPATTNKIFTETEVFAPFSSISIIIHHHHHHHGRWKSSSSVMRYNHSLRVVASQSTLFNCSHLPAIFQDGQALRNVELSKQQINQRLFWIRLS